MVGTGDWWHPKWWRADTKHEEVVTLKNMEQVCRYSLLSCCRGHFLLSVKCLEHFGLQTHL